MLDRTQESPQEHCHKTRRTLMSTEERKIAHCTQNQLEMKPVSSALAPYTSRVPSGLISLRKLKGFTLKTVSGLEKHQFQYRSMRKVPCTPYRLEKRADAQDSIEEVGQLSTTTSRGAFPQQ